MRFKRYADRMTTLEDFSRALDLTFASNVLSKLRRERQIRSIRLRGPY